MARNPAPPLGALAPNFTVMSDANPAFRFASLGGVWMVLMFFGSQRSPFSAAALETIQAQRELFDDRDAYFFGVSIDPGDRDEHGLRTSLPGLRYFWDFDAAVSRLYGVAGDGVYEPAAFLIDRQQRIVAAAPVAAVDTLLARLKRELEAERASTADVFAPVLTLPRVFEPELCRELIAYYAAIGGRPSGFMREKEGLTVGVSDPTFKLRNDVTIADEGLLDAARKRLSYRLIPAIEKFLGWRATRIERYIVASYAADGGGFFRAHRDNTTPATAHRKFAVTLNLNAEDYDGGELRFPEFGMRTYKPPTGGATVFCCSLLHEATPVTRGVRYAFLPFLYDEAGRAVRTANLHTLAPAQADAD